jgi:hypothetical protein
MKTSGCCSRVAAKIVLFSHGESPLDNSEYALVRHAESACSTNNR